MLMSVVSGVMTRPTEATPVTPVLANEVLVLALEDLDMMFAAPSPLQHVMFLPAQASVMAPVREG